MNPQSWEQVGIWLATQFPVLAAAAFLVRWVLRWNGDRHAEEIKRFQSDKQTLLAEKDIRITERDRHIEKLEAEIRTLREKLSRNRKKGTDRGAPG